MWAWFEDTPPHTRPSASLLTTAVFKSIESLGQVTCPGMPDDEVVQQLGYHAVPFLVRSRGGGGRGGTCL